MYGPPHVCKGKRLLHGLVFVRAFDFTADLLEEEIVFATLTSPIDEQAHHRAEIRLRKPAAQLGFQLLPIPATGE
jgi:hypothetical protein